MKIYNIMKIKQVCDVIAGQSPQGKYYNRNGKGLPFYQGKKDFGEIFIKKPTVWTTEVTKEALKDDILMSVRAPVGPINFATTKICIGRGLAAIRTGKDVNKDYLFNFLLSIQSDISGREGAVFASINKSEIENIDIPLPPRPEQKRIVGILDKVFADIAKAKENAEKNLQNTRKIFSTYLQNTLKKVSSSCGVVNLGKACEGVEYGTSSKSLKKGKVPVLRMGNIQNGRFDWSRLVYSSEESEIKKYALKYNDVLFNRTNSLELVGKTAIYKGEMPAIFAGYLIRIKRKEDLLDADYLNYFLNSDMAREYGKTVVISSVNQANINGQKLKNYPIPLPPLSEQLNITTKLDSISVETRKLESIYQKKLDDLEELKKSILQKAFNGEL